MIVEEIAIGEVLKYTIDYAPRGLGTDTIASNAFTVSDAAMVLASPGNTTTTVYVNVDATAMVAGSFYTLFSRAVGASGQVYKEAVTFRCIPARVIGA